jgi:hypothetical protein
MSHFARVQDGTVTEVIVIEQDMIDTGLWGPPQEWIQTSYNTRAGINTCGRTPLRKNFAGVGYTYDTVLDAFIPPKPFDSWVLDEDMCQWKAPIDYPNDGNAYVWDDEVQQWELSAINPLAGEQ